MTTRAFGYAIEQENRELLAERGEEPTLMLSRHKAAYPEFNDGVENFEAVLNIVDQGQVGSCQGQSLAKCFQICYFLATGRVEYFSAMHAYLLSQKHDGLLGRDVGSTLSGGQAAAAEGICLEQAFPYTGRYHTDIPSDVGPVFKMTSSKPTNDPDLILEALKAGLPVQTGIAWNSSVETEVVRSYRGGGGGHATTLWLIDSDGNPFNNNSWGEGWMTDGRQVWHLSVFRQIIRHQGNTFVIYSPAGLTYPELEPTGLAV